MFVSQTAYVGTVVLGCPAEQSSARSVGGTGTRALEPTQFFVIPIPSKASGGTCFSPPYPPTPATHGRPPRTLHKHKWRKAPKPAPSNSPYISRISNHPG